MYIWKKTPSINKNEILPYENITDDDMSEEKKKCAK